MKKLIIFILCITLAMMLSSCTVSTANFTELTIASQIDDDNKPLSVADTFATDAPMIYVTGTLNNAPEGTKIKADWVYVDSDPVIDIDSATYEAKEITTDFHFSLSKPNNGWPTGSYEVKLYIDDNLKETLTFDVE